MVIERKLHNRIFDAAEKYEWRYAYCVEDDVFCDVDVSYSDYINKHYICFRKQPNGTVSYNVPFEAHLPLSMKWVDTVTVTK